MNQTLTIQNIQNLLITIQNKQVLFDRDVAELYGVQTKRINEAVKNNPDKFPDEYLVEITEGEWKNLQSKF